MNLTTYVYSMIIVVTEFTRKSWRLYPEFFVDTVNVVRQIKSSSGIIKMRINPVTLKTITAWKTQEEMLSFRNSGAHLQAMKKTRAFGQISSASWEDVSIPSWKTAIAALPRR